VALPPLASAADLEAALQREPGSLNAAAADLALRRASGRVRKYTRQVLTFIAGETIDVPAGGRVLRVPQRPLVVDADNPLSVVELADFSGIEWVALENRDYSRVGDELTRGYPWQAPSRLMGWPYNRTLGVWAPKVRLTYSHGYREIPDDLMDVVLDLAAMNLSNPENLRSVAIDDYQRTFAAETIGSAQLTKGHKADLRPYRVAAFSVAPS
jgi:hypothetical protein